MILVIIILAVIICLFLTVQYSLFFPPVKGLPILMYHKVSLDSNDALTVSVENLERQFKYFSEHNYINLPLGQIIDKSYVKLPKRVFVLTFDDAYLNNLEYLYPLLQKYNYHVTIMLPVGFIGKTNEWDGGSEPLMDYGQLLSMDSRYVSFGLHTYSHSSVKTMDIDDIAADIEKCKRELNDHGINFLPVLAYPYGRFPSDEGKKEAFFELLKTSGIVCGLRIGNKINKWPLRDRYEVRRIHIKGDESFWKFKTRIRKGHVKML